MRQAEAALALASAGARPEAVALAEAKLAQVEAARDGLRVQTAKYAIASPLAGIVTSRIADPGEMAAPGAPLLVVADLSQITLVVYVPEPRIGLVRVGQEAQVSVDAYPDRTFTGAVSYITPRRVHSQERPNPGRARGDRLCSRDQAYQRRWLPQARHAGRRRACAALT